MLTLANLCGKSATFNKIGQTSDILTKFGFIIQFILGVEVTRFSTIFSDFGRKFEKMFKKNELRTSDVKVENFRGNFWKIFEKRIWKFPYFSAKKT